MFPAVTFRRLSLSHVRLSHSLSDEVYTVFMLANDLFRGTFHYQITVKITPVPSITVKLLAMRELGTTDLQNPNAPFGISIGGTFVSAWALGSAGMRGVWVDRLRGNIDRRVVAFTTHPSSLHSNEQPSQGGSGSGGDEGGSEAGIPAGDAPHLHGRVIWDISSYDLRGGW